MNDCGIPWAEIASVVKFAIVAIAFVLFMNDWPSSRSRK